MLAQRYLCGGREQCFSSSTQSLPDGVYVQLAGFHVDVDVPQVEALSMGIDDAFKYCSSPLRIPKLILHLSKL